LPIGVATTCRQPAARVFMHRIPAREVCGPVRAAARREHSV
jgi:hypothetical protein